MSKVTWAILFILSGSITIFLGIQTLMNVWSYVSLDISIPIKVISWEVEQKSGDWFIPVAVFEYEVSGEKYISRKEISSHSALNIFSGYKLIEHYKRLRWTGWINSAHPEKIAIEKEISFKKIFYFLVSLSILLYFVYLERTYKPYLKEKF